MEFINPTGGTEIIHTHAERLDTLDGKTIGFLTNDEWQAYRTLPVIKEALEDQFNVKVLALKTFPVGIKPFKAFTVLFFCSYKM